MTILEVPQPATPVHTTHTASRVSDAFLERVSRDFAREHLILSQGWSEGLETLIVASDTDPSAVFNIGVLLERPVSPIETDPEIIARLIDEAYAGSENPTGEPDEPADDDEVADLDRLLESADRDLLSTEGKGPVVKLVDALLFDALGRQASDLHVEPMADCTLVRYRLDGVLHTVRQIPRTIATAVVSRIKVMGRMDIAERRIPQDGRCTVTIGRAPIDLRISTLPTSYGERSVIRLLDKSRNAELLSLTSLGMPKDIEPTFLERASRSSGILLVTGPTGSGKTTTLYATLRWIADLGGGERNVLTIEDPIEYQLSSIGVPISQAQVNIKKGVTFASGLRHILRQDPDVIMIGEIRDTETARVAIQASLTGHLVFSTLHTNDAASAVTRLIDLGVEPYLLSASLTAVLAQRLARRLHSPCAGEGCEGCLDSGFRGRIGVYELLVVDPQVKAQIALAAPLATVRETARANQMRTLAEEGRRLIAAGTTTEDEINRVVQGANE